MKVEIYDQYSEIVPGKDYHTGKPCTQLKSLSSFEYDRGSDLSQQDAFDLVDNIIEETKQLGTNFTMVIQKPGYAEMKINLPELKGNSQLYRVVYTK